MFVNIIKGYRDVVAICDSDLLGKKFEELSESGELILQLDVKENFYKGKEGREIDNEELLALIKSFSLEDATFNIVGENSVAVAIRAGIVSRESVKRIQEIPYAMVFI